MTSDCCAVAAASGGDGGLDAKIRTAHVEHGKRALTSVRKRDVDNVAGLRATQRLADRRGERHTAFVVARAPSADELVLGGPARVVLHPHA